MPTPTKGPGESPAGYAQAQYDDASTQETEQL